MSLMCPLEGCKGKEGMCSHEKAMLGLIGIIVALALIVKLL